MHTGVVCVHKKWCVCMHHLVGQKCLDVLVALLLLEWTHKHTHSHTHMHMHTFE